MEVIDDIIETKDPEHSFNNTYFLNNDQQKSLWKLIPDNPHNKIIRNEQEIMHLYLLNESLQKIVNSFSIYKWYSNIYCSQSNKNKSQLYDTISYLHYKEKDKIYEDFFTSLEESYSEHIDIINNIPFELIQKEVEFVLNMILEHKISHKNIIVGISNDASAYIFTEVNNKKITIDLFFEKFDDSYETDALLNIVENKNNICSYSNTVPAVLEEVSKFLM